MRVAILLLVLLVIGGSVALGFAADAPPAAKPAAITPQDAEFFETRVRPVLAENCYACHGPKMQMGGLRFDTRAGFLKGGDHGPVAVIGEPAKSALIQAIGYEGRLKMPPAGKLKPEAIAALTAWVKMGAPWPEVAAAPGTAASPAKDLKKTHWSFQPVRCPAIPAVKSKAWVKTPIDAFVLAKLEAKGLKPSPWTDRRTLIRRATFDLLGLPPTATEIDAFLADRSPDAFAKVVDRLLASPQYGERWGRYWLDVARYADTKGYVFNEERRYPFAYTYRDYVVRAFNADLPYDQFLIQQIAGDRLPLGEDKRALAALGFLTLGRRFLNNQGDIIDDRIDVVTRGTLALTVACARCHDHKFDPIPTADYYSLYGVFANSIEPKQLPLIGEPARTDAYLAYEKSLKAAQEEIDRYLDTKVVEVRARLRLQVGDYLLALYDAQKLPDEDRRVAFARQRELSSQMMQRWQAYLEKRHKEHDPVFAAWDAFAALPEKEFAAQAPALAARLAANADPQHRLNPLVAQLCSGAPPQTLKEVAQRYGALFAGVDKEWQDANQAAPKPAESSPPAAPEPAAAGLTDADREALRQVLYGEQAPPNVAVTEIDRLMNRAERERVQALQRKVDQVKASPDAPPHAMVLEDAATPRQPRILIRGNANNQGPEVQRQFLGVLSGEKREPFKEGSGRLELARAIASKSNPLTARVMVNRVWLHHFGAGLVRTPGDFGTRGELPTHPELLDYLAWRFMEEGWSVKKLHRLIMLSSTYQQSSESNPRYDRIDPENRLVWRMNRQRLDLEATRDSLLAAAGRLDGTLGGPAVELTTEPYPTRRTIYGFIDRQNLQGLFRTFDLASPDTTSPQRYTTTVPQQALFMMNSPFVIEQARSLAQRAAAGSLEHRIQQLYRLTYGRWATTEEVQIAVRYLQSPESQRVEPPSRETPTWQSGYGEYGVATHRVSHFQALPFWTGSQWQGSKEYPDADLGHLRLSAAGGHPGKDRAHAAIRRWVAPRDGAVAISGTLGHVAQEGDGVQAYVVSSRDGELGQWTAHGGQAMTSVPRIMVKAGDTLDFVVECRENNNSDGFTWAPMIRTIGRATGSGGALAEWSAESGFRGPPPAAVQPLTAWERYAQVLLISNEFVFVD